VADWVSWADSSVAYSIGAGVQLSLAERSTTSFLPIEEGIKSERKRKTVAAAIEIHPLN